MKQKQNKNSLSHEGKQVSPGRLGEAAGLSKGVGEALVAIWPELTVQKGQGKQKEMIIKYE